MKLVKYFLQKKSVTILLLILVLGGGLFSYIKMGKLEDAPFTIKQALVMTPYPGASPSEVQSQVTDVLEESIQSLGELYYLKTENRAGLSKITVYVKKEIRADEMQQLWDKLRRKVNDVQSKLPAGAGPSVVNDDFGDVLGVFYGLTGEGYSYRELENQAKLIKNVLLRVKDVAKVEIYGVQSPTIDVILNPSVMARSGITTTDISRAFDAQNRVVDAGGIDAGVNRIRIESTGNFYSLDDIRNMTIVSRTGEHFRLADIAEIEESYQTPPSNKMRIDGKPAVGIAISTIPTGNVVDMAEAVKLEIDHFAETMTAVVVEDDTEAGRKKAMFRCEEMVKEAFANIRKDEKSEFQPDGKIIKQSDTLEEYSEKVNKIKQYIIDGHVFQTVLSQRWTIETKQKGFDLYKELREINPSPYMYYFNFEEFEIIGSSPEMIVKQKDNKVLTCPIAGTRPRGKDDAEDQKLAEGLMKDPKEKAEHVMLVDLARNDMGRIAEFGTVKVRDFMHIQKYSHVMHIVSLVEGRKKGEYHPLDLVNAFLPAGTLSGAPKVRAMEIIDELESVRRGLYGGAIGYIDFNGDMDFCITIRTMIKKADKVYIQAGAGIVADSNPESEYNECCNKARALAKVLVP